MKFLFFTFFFVGIFSGCFKDNFDKIEVLGPQEFCDSLQANDNIQLIDVRTPEEYDQSHILNSELINLQNEKEFLEKTRALDKSKPVYVYCRTGGRSNVAAKHLANNGFKEIKDLKGGIVAWKDENHNCQ